MNQTKTKSTAWLLTLATVVAVSPFVLAFLPIKGNVVSILAIGAILISKAAWRGIGEKYFYWCLVIVFISVIPTLYWQQPRLMLIPIYFVLSVLAVSVLSKDDIKDFVELLSWLILAVLWGAVFGTLYAYFGGVPILEFANEDGRLNQLYLTTLTNSQFENFIRPSGIFDEPGALSFVTCLVAALRHAMGRNKKTTWILLALGIVTMSVAHLIYILLHAAEEFKNHRRIKDVFMVVGVAAVCSWVLVAFIQPIQDILSASFFSRFSDDTLGSLGQDRITALMNAAGYIDINTFMFGLDSDCAVGFAHCTFDKGYENYGDNPLTLLVHWGGFLAFPYYFALAYLTVKSIQQRSFVMFGILLLLLQRPYVMSYGYSLLIVLTIFVLAKKHASKDMRELPMMPMTPDVLPAA